MEQRSLLEGKRVLIVDDEPDVLDTLEELLSMCNTYRASSFDEARELLENEPFDIAILDIMGVAGFKLLETANRKNVIAIMLTAHALSPEKIVKSYRGGAASYIPKDEMSNIKLFLNDILEAKERGEHYWWRWFARLGSFWKQKFGYDWKLHNRDFWKKFPIKEKEDENEN